MRKTIFGVVAVTAFLAFPPVWAADMECTDANMAKVNTDVMKMTSGETKVMATKEMDMAKDMMAKKDMTNCMIHMNKASQMGMPR